MVTYPTPQYIHCVGLDRTRVSFVAPQSGHSGTEAMLSASRPRLIPEHHWVLQAGPARRVRMLLFRRDQEPRSFAVSSGST